MEIYTSIARLSEYPITVARSASNFLKMPSTTSSQSKGYDITNPFGVPLPLLFCRMYCIKAPSKSPRIYRFHYRANGDC